MCSDGLGKWLWLRAHGPVSRHSDWWTTELSYVAGSWVLTGEGWEAGVCSEELAKGGFGGTLVSSMSLAFLRSCAWSLGEVEGSSF